MFYLFFPSSLLSFLGRRISVFFLFSSSCFKGEEIKKENVVLLFIFSAFFSFFFFVKGKRGGKEKGSSSLFFFFLFLFRGEGEKEGGFYYCG